LLALIASVLAANAACIVLTVANGLLLPIARLVALTALSLMVSV
jgi:hypothetical protein